MKDASFDEFVLDQLRTLPDVQKKSMFGAHGIYSGETFFGILDEGRLFFKTDVASQEDYISRGMNAFTYNSRGKTVTLGFHEVPPDILENSMELASWAQRSIQIAVSSKKIHKQRT